MAIGGGAILLIVVAVIFALIFHLTSGSRAAKIIGFIGCGFAVVGAVLGFLLIGFIAFMAGLAGSLAVQVYSQYARS